MIRCYVITKITKDNNRYNTECEFNYGAHYRAKDNDSEIVRKEIKQHLEADTQVVHVYERPRPKYTMIKS